MDILGGIICTILFFAVIIVWKYVEESNKNKLHSFLYERVQWCVANNDFRDGYSLTEYILIHCNDIEIQYRIIHDDQLQFVDTLLLDFASNLQSSYFENSLSKNKQIMHLSCKEYFFLYLVKYLDKNNHSKYKEYELYDITSKEDVSKYTYKYSFTDYGMTYQKLLYVALHFCINNDNLKDIVRKTFAEQVKNGIDKNQIILIK